MLLWKKEKNHTHTHAHAHTHMHAHTQILRVETHGLIGELWFYCVVSDSDILWGTKRFQVMTWVVEASADTRFAVINTCTGKGVIESCEIRGLESVHVNIFWFKLFILCYADNSSCLWKVQTFSQHVWKSEDKQQRLLWFVRVFFFFFLKLWWSSIILE